MFRNLGRWIHVYYVVILATLIGFAGWGIYYYWNAGLASGNYAASVYELSFKIDDLKKTTELKNIPEIISSGKPRDALVRLEAFEKKVNDIHIMKDSGQESAELKQKLQLSKEHLSNLLSMSDVNARLSIFVSKMTELNNFVTGNKWPTLMRSAERIQVRLSQYSMFSPDHIKAVSRAAMNDLNMMQTVATSSVITDENKKQIVSRLAALRSDLEIVEKYFGDLAAFNNEFKQIAPLYVKWLDTLSPDLALEKLRLKEKSETMVFVMGAFVLFALLSLIGGIVLNYILKKKNVAKMEDDVLVLLKDYLLSSDPKVEVDGGPRFVKDFNQIREYVQKRMSFGSIFQEGLPFSALLLDSNFKVIWANPLFYDSWNLGNCDADKNLLTWDYLTKLTNLGEKDPVAEAFQSNIAGVFQIQVKRHDSRNDYTMVPYEMFVSPVQFYGQKRIMLCFYPLTSIEETIVSQARALVNPVNDSLDALYTGTFHETNVQEKLFKEFDVAGISYIFDKFKTFHDHIIESQQVFKLQLEHLDSELSDRNKLIGQIGNINSDVLNLNGASAEHLQKLKEIIVNLVDAKSRQLLPYHDCRKINEELLKEIKNLMKECERHKHQNKALNQSMQALLLLRNDLREMKKAKLENSTPLDQALVHISKAEMILHSSDKEETAIRDWESIVSDVLSRTQKIELALEDVLIQGTKLEESIVEELKKVFDSYKDAKEKNKFIVKLTSMCKEGQGVGQEQIELFH